VHLPLIQSCLRRRRLRAIVQVNHTIMKQIVSNPNTDYIFGDDFDELAEHLDSLVHQACRTVQTTTPTTPSRPAAWSPESTTTSTVDQSLPFCDPGATTDPLPPYEGIAQHNYIDDILLDTPSHSACSKSCGCWSPKLPCRKHEKWRASQRPRPQKFRGPENLQHIFCMRSPGRFILTLYSRFCPESN